MRIFGMGVPELLVILAIILLIFGPKNLPKLGSALGKTVKSLRDGLGTSKKEVKESSEKSDDDSADDVVVESVETESKEAPAKTVRKVVVKKAQ